MVSAPTQDELEEAEIYEDVLSPEEADLKLTERAAEVRLMVTAKVHRMMLTYRLSH